MLFLNDELGRRSELVGIGGMAAGCVVGYAVGAPLEEGFWVLSAVGGGFVGMFIAEVVEAVFQSPVLAGKIALNLVLWLFWSVVLLVVLLATTCFGYAVFESLS